MVWVLVIFFNYHFCCVHAQVNSNGSIFPSKAVWLECVQERNDIIFVPSGWYHQVHNLEDTISINHNWFNGHNLTWVWDLLFKDYEEAKGYIEDIKDICDDFEGLCQRNLAANTGINFHDFFIFIVRLTFANFVLYLHARKDGNLKQKPSQRQKESSAYFNLISARYVMNRMRSTAPEYHHWISTDSKINFKDPAFLKLCNGLVRTYSGIYKCDKLDDLAEDLVDDLMGSDKIDWDFRVSSPDDLIDMIDRFLTKLGSIE